MSEDETARGTRCLVFMTPDRYYEKRLFDLTQRRLRRKPRLRREVEPVFRIRLELLAFFAGVSTLSFWASMTW